MKTVLSLQRELKWQGLSLAKIDPKTDSRKWPSENVTLVALMLSSAKNRSQKGLFWDPVKSNKLDRKLYQLTLRCQSLHYDGKMSENDTQSVNNCAKWNLKGITSAANGLLTNVKDKRDFKSASELSSGGAFL